MTTFTPDMPIAEIRATVSAAPEGNSFLFKPGLYRMISLCPRDCQQFMGEPGATFSGALKVDTVQEGDYWVVLDQTQNGQRNGLCAAGKSLCTNPEEVFYDSTRLAPVATPGEVGSGKFFFDYAKFKIYLSGSSETHLLEVSTLRSAFWGDAEDVLISGLTIEKYASPGQMGAIGGQYPPLRWSVVNCVIRQNHGAGVMAGTGWKITNSRIYNNGQLGVRGEGRDIVLEDNTISGNNRAGYNTSWEAGGAKFVSTTDLKVVRCAFVENVGCGLWTDLDAMNTLVESNTFERNTGPGWHHEISYKAVGRDNIFRCNAGYGVRSFGLRGSQMQIYNSSDLDFYNNTLIADGSSGENGIGILNDDRGLGPRGLRVSRNNQIHDNQISHTAPEHRNGFISAHDGEWLLKKSGNVFDRNTYEVRSDFGWVWGEPGTWEQFRAAGQEPNGRMSIK